MKETVLALLLTLTTGLWAHADTVIEKRHEIDKMLRLTGMEKMMSQMKSQMMAAFRAQWSQVPGEFWDRFELKLDTRELLEKIIPLYDKYYTLEDLKAVNAFYESPAGKKVLATLPQIMQESMKIGQEWGAKIGKEAAAEVQAEEKKK